MLHGRNNRWKIKDPLSAEGWEVQEPAGKIKDPLNAEGWEYKKDPLNAVRFTLKRAAVGCTL